MDMRLSAAKYYVTVPAGRECEFGGVNPWNDDPEWNGGLLEWSTGLD